jgi:hypothetical protein
MGEFCLQHRRVERHSAQSVTMPMVIIAIVLAQGTAALGETLTCSARLHIRTCQGPGGYTSTEMQWQGMTLGQDSAGDRWTTTRWRDTTVTTVTPPPER